MTIRYAKLYNRSRDAVIHVWDKVGNVIARATLAISKSRKRDNIWDFEANK